MRYDYIDTILDVHLRYDTVDTSSTTVPTLHRVHRSHRVVSL